MDTFLFAVDAVLPIILIIVLGYILKKIGLLTKDILGKMNKLCFVVLLPTLLFHNVYSIDNLTAINWAFIGYGVGAMLLISLTLSAVVYFLEKENARRGVLMQCMVRSNYAIIGIPLAFQIAGTAGAATASLLSAFTIPTFNILAVVVLSIFAPIKADENGLLTKPTVGKKIKSTLLGIVKNPLIIGVVIGLIMLAFRQLFVNLDISFRLYNMSWFKTTVSYVANAATPVALLVLGGQFEFSVIGKLKKQILIGVVGRCLIIPTVGLIGAYFLVPSLGADHFASYLALFATPVAASSAILAQEMGGDGDLAGQLVVWTTLCSTFTLFITIMILKAIGIF